MYQYFKNKYEKKCQDRARIYIQTNYREVSYKGWELNLNFQCHFNALHYAKDKWYKIVSCYVWDPHGECYISHFINKTSRWIYIDNTIGKTDFYTTCYVVNEIPIASYSPIWDLNNLKKHMFAVAYTNPILNWIFWYKRSNVI